MSRSTQSRSTQSVLAGAALTATLVLSGCAGSTTDEEASDPQATESSSTPSSPSPTESDDSSSDASDTAAPEPSGPSLEVTVEGEQVSPNAAELSVATGEPITMRITADRAGEFHVHSNPEQYVEFGAGTTEQELVIETPGTVEIEEHESGAVVAVVEVR